MMKLKQAYQEIILPAGLLASMVIGAGMFALPYTFTRAGFLMGAFYLFVFGAVAAYLHVIYGRIIALTPEKHRFVGYVRTYLGRRGFGFSIFTTLVGNFFSLTAYLVLSKGFIEMVWTPPASDYIFFAFWITGAFAIIAGIKRLASFEFLVTIVMCLIMGFIFLSGVMSPSFSFSSLPSLGLGYWFLPYGVVLFALSGRSAVSSIKEYYEENGLSERRFPLALVIGTIVPAVLYLLFALGVFGLSGEGVTADTVSGLTALSPVALAGVGLLGIFALWTSYVLIGIELKEILNFDFSLPEAVDAVAATCIPLGLYLIGFTNFMSIVSITGAVFLALEAVLLVLIWQKIRGKASMLGYALMAVFVGGAIYELLKLVCDKIGDGTLCKLA